MIYTTLTTILASSLLISPIPSISYPLGDLEVKVQSYGADNITSVTPNASLYKVDKKLYTKEVAKFQFNDKQVTAANHLAADLLVKDFINSPALNSTREEYNMFVDTRTEYNPELLKTFKAPETPGTSYTPIIPLTTPDLLLPTITSDTLPKMTGSDINLKYVSATEYKKKPQIVIAYDYTTPYRVTDEEVLNYTRLLNSVKTDSVGDLLKDKVFEPGDDNVFTVQGDIEFTLAPKGDSWEVVGLKTAYQYDVTDFTQYTKTN